MCKSASAYFEGVVAGKNPLKKNFGIAVRMMNLKKHEDSTLALKDGEKDLFFFDVKKEDDHYVSTGNDWALVVATAAGDEIGKTVDACYDVLDRVSFAGGYYRPKFDFNSTEYQNSIPNRYDFVNGWLFDAAEWQEGRGNRDKNRFDTLKNKHDGEMKTAKADYEQKLNDIKSQMEAILNE